MKPRVYLDTSVISAYFDERWAERQQETLHFFQCAPAEYSLALSAITLFELRKTKDESRRSEMLEFAAQFELVTLTTAAEKLAWISKPVTLCLQTNSKMLFTWQSLSREALSLLSAGTFRIW